MAEADPCSETKPEGRGELTLMGPADNKNGRWKAEVSGDRRVKASPDVCEKRNATTVPLGSYYQAAAYYESEERVVSADGCNGFTIKRETLLEGKTENRGVLRGRTMVNRN